MRVCLLVSFAFLLACTKPTPDQPAPPTVTPAVEPEPATTVTLRRLSNGLWLHTSTRSLDEWGTVPSHGLVVEHEDGPLLLDTAWGAAATTELLAQIERELGKRPQVAIVTDFHDDRAGGVEALTAAGVEVWSSAGVIAALEAASAPTPEHAFEQLPWSGTIGGVDVEVVFPGAGHTRENLTVWLPEQRVLLGGCLLRDLDSRSPGNLADADLDAWVPTLQALKTRYPNVETIVPSHGEPGDARLLDHTLALVRIALDARAAERGEPLPTRMAITVDDLPSHGPLPRGRSRAEVHRQLLDAFASHGVPAVRGYVIGQHALDDPDRRASLDLWLAAGHPLGNHTWSHPNMEEIGVDAYLADIDRNEAVLAELRRTYIDRAIEMLEWHKAAAIDAFGRPIAHVLLLHGGVFTAEMIEALLAAYEARGVVWIELDEALADPVYRDVPLPPRTHGDVIVEQAVTSLGASHPPWTRHPGALLDALCR